MRKVSVVLWALIDGPYEAEFQPFRWHVVTPAAAGCMTLCGVRLYTATTMSVGVAPDNQRPSNMDTGEEVCGACVGHDGVYAVVDD